MLPLQKLIHMDDDELAAHLDGVDHDRLRAIHVGVTETMVQAAKAGPDKTTARFVRNLDRLEEYVRVERVRRSYRRRADDMGELVG